MTTIRHSRPDDIPQLAALWRASVRATHDFLSEDDFRALDVLVSQEYLPVAALTVAIDGGNVILGFLGATGLHVDSLFIHPDARGQGIGKALLMQLRQKAGPNPLTVDVNEQNVQALGFYRHQGFDVTGRSQHDAQGRPYPVLHLAEPANRAWAEQRQ